MAVPTKDRGAGGAGASLAQLPVRPRLWWAAVPIAAWLLFVAGGLVDDPRGSAVSAALVQMRALLAGVVVFGVTGLGVTRLLLPATLRRHEWLWVLPTGACVTSLALMALGFAALPFLASLALVLLGGLALSARAVRRHGPPASPAAEGAVLPALLALGVFAVCVTPVVALMQFGGVSGTGSDAHMAAGAADFLAHAYPTSTDARLPVDSMPILWKSKYPIYYGFAAVAQVAGLQTWQALVPLIALLMGIAALGMFLVAREVLGATLGVALLAMGFAGFCRMVVHTGLNPYHNQTWGYMAMPFTLVLAWWLVRPGETPAARRRAAALLALFLGVVAFAYPLAAPIPAVPLLVFLWRERRRRIRDGRPVPRLRRLYRGPRSLLWIVPALLVLAIPFVGFSEKFSSASQLATNRSLSLAGWAGDMRAFIPMNHFFNLPDGLLFQAVVVGLVVLVIAELRKQPRDLAIGLGILFAGAIVQAIQFRYRDYGYYFHFKILAFVAPLLLVIAAVGAARLRRAGPLLLAAFAVATAVAVRAEVRETGQQLGQPTTELADWAGALPRDASVRLDMSGPDQLWGAYFLADRRVCSTHPLYATDYPRVAFSRKADYAVAMAGQPPPPEAAGPPLRENVQYALYRLDPQLPGTDTCTQRQRSRVTQASLGNG